MKLAFRAAGALVIASVPKTGAFDIRALIPSQPLSSGSSARSWAGPRSSANDGRRARRRMSSSDSVMQVHAAGPEQAPLVSPSLGPSSGSSVLVRYIYEGGKLSRDAKLIDLPLKAQEPGKMSGCFAADLLAALVADGVSLERFFVCAFENVESGGAWLPLLKNMTSLPEGGLQGDRRGPYFPFPLYGPGDKRPRIDLMLERRESFVNRPGPTDVVSEGYFGVGIVGAKTGFNVGSLWRAAFQLGAQFIFTVGGRYEQTEAMDSLSADARLPLFEYSNWADFAAHSPEGAVWIGVEMGGEPLETFEHPARAVYLLGSEDTGLPASVAAACHSVITLPSVLYESFNVAMAGSIIMYDRVAKEKTQGHPSSSQFHRETSISSLSSSASATVTTESYVEAGVERIAVPDPTPGF